MDVNEEDLVGEPVDEVPQREPGYDCNARKSEGGTFTGYCGARAGKGTDHVGEGRCSNHGGAADNRGEKNGNYKHGAYSKHLRSDLSDREREAMDDLVGDLEDEEASLDVVREMAAEAALKYKRCGDHRFLREFRQLVSEFNLAPNEDHVELQAEVESEHSLDDETREAVREVLSHRREASNE